MGWAARPRFQFIDLSKPYERGEREQNLLCMAGFKSKNKAPRLPPAGDIDNLSAQASRRGRVVATVRCATQLAVVQRHKSGAFKILDRHGGPWPLG